MSQRGDKYRRKAAEFKAISAVMQTPEARQAYEQTAQSYERQAERVDRIDDDKGVKAPE